MQEEAHFVEIMVNFGIKWSCCEIYKSDDAEIWSEDRFWGDTKSNAVFF